MKTIFTLLIVFTCIIGRSQNLVADSTFNGTGMAIATSESTAAFCNSMLYQPDGKIVLVGNYLIPHPVFHITGFLTYRFHSTGANDTLYGDSSRTRTKFYPFTEDDVLATALQSDGKIVLAGVAAQNFAMARYRPNGIIDSTFGNNGTVESLYGGGYVKDIRILSNGSILVAGKCGGAFALAQYFPSGLPDTNFGINGLSIAGTNLNSPEPSLMELQPDGKIIMVGQCWDNATGNDWLIMRFKPNGVIDSTFGTNGMTTIDFGTIYDYAVKVHVRSNGKIVVTGNTTAANGSYKFAAAELLPNGTLNSSFGNGGKIIENSTADHNFLYSSLLLSNGDLYLSGNLKVNKDFLKSIPVVMKLNANGQFNYSFANNGYYHLTQNYNTVSYSNMLQQPNGKLLICGYYAQPGYGPQMMVSRYKIVAATTTVNTGVDEFKKNDKVTVFPNPANNFIQIGSNITGEFDVTLFDIEGKTVYKSRNEKRINVSGLSAGVYFIKLETEEKGVVYSTKFIKQ
ncbi:MAG: T9SS type A sorting domain-containing protein [Bacteroidia bacterium]|nr:T9SS type A sorting domain-containing protein [Bacteroidia bacterium]